MTKRFLKAITLCTAVILAAPTFSLAGGSVGYGDISIYKNDVLTTKMTGQNPVEDGSLLVCDGKCMFKSEGVSLVALDGSKIAIAGEPEIFKLYVREGSVDYVINNNSRKIAFYTPQGTYTAAEVIFNASTSPVVKGNVLVGDDGKTEITVTEGRMVFATAEGMKTVDANNKIVLAQLPVDKKGLGLEALVAGGLVITEAVVTAIDINNFNDKKPQQLAADTTPSASPSN
ncbi:hypothetical protein [Desulforhopalus singaporensis]|uniref:FecR family protein n=1 Tax=Desulforhopalus singaporensis TaxID=91360 RepID=A0A1H0UZR5_9BACT|nr:hypothetical protein [Desulforhopalus singaporensis]SDP71336.1 hypothetical protein SAMN05660330_03790 [Desulforhopalus singaporensis]